MKFLRIVKFSKHIVFPILLVLLAACSSTQAIKPAAVKPITKSKTKLSRELPFTFKITDDLNDGENLFVRAKLSALNAWNPNFVFIQLKGFENGELVEQITVPLQQAISDQHPQAQKKFIAKRFENLFLIFSIPSDSLTDYQLELLWGQEATASLTAVEEVEAVVIKDVKILKQKDCDDCPQISLLKATVQNKAEAAVVALTLEVGFKLLRSPKSKQSQQIIEINDLILPPQAEQDLEFELGSQSEENKNLIPLVHILNYQLKSE